MSIFLNENIQMPYCVFILGERGKNSPKTKACETHMQIQLGS